jgi:hypothetical protein
MERRAFLASGTGAAVAIISGCNQIRQSGDGGRPELEWQYQAVPAQASSGWFVYVLATFENVGSSDSGRVEVDITVSNSDGRVIGRDNVVLSGVAPGEEQQLWSEIPASPQTLEKGIGNVEFDTTFTE